MHEWALAEAVISTVDKIYRENNKKSIHSVNISIGEIQSIEMDIFREGLKIILDEYPFGPEVFQFKTEKASFKCNCCGKEWLLEDHAECGEEEREAIHFLPEAAHVYMRCPYCDSPDFKLLKGRGVSIESVELDPGND